MKPGRVEASEGPQAGCPGKRTAMNQKWRLLTVFLCGVLSTVATACSVAAGDADSDGGSLQGPEPSVAQAAEDLSSNALTKQQASTVLKLVDDICGDTWCEGDRNFHFDQIRCTRPRGNTKGSCRLAFRMFPYDSDLSTGPTYARSCTTPGFNGFASLVDTAPNGYQSLNWDYYDALTSCISEIESKLPPL